MRDFITDALRSSIPSTHSMRSLPRRMTSPKDVNATVSEQMAAYGFTPRVDAHHQIALPTGG